MRIPPSKKTRPATENNYAVREKVIGPWHITNCENNPKQLVRKNVASFSETEQKNLNPIDYYRWNSYFSVDLKEK